METNGKGKERDGRGMERKERKLNEIILQFRADNIIIQRLYYYTFMDILSFDEFDQFWKVLREMYKQNPLDRMRS